MIQLAEAFHNFFQLLIFGFYLSHSNFVVFHFPPSVAQNSCASVATAIAVALIRGSPVKKSCGRSFASTTINRLRRMTQNKSIRIIGLKSIYLKTKPRGIPTFLFLSRISPESISKCVPIVNFYRT